MMQVEALVVGHRHLCSSENGYLFKGDLMLDIVACTCTHVQGINEVADHFGSWKKGPESEKQFEPMVDQQSILQEYSHFTSTLW